jgi:hypothetical protein
MPAQLINACSEAPPAIRSVRLSRHEVSRPQARMMSAATSPGIKKLRVSRRHLRSAGAICRGPELLPHSNTDETTSLTPGQVQVGQASSLTVDVRGLEMSYSDPQVVRGSRRPAQSSKAAAVRPNPGAISCRRRGSHHGQPHVECRRAPAELPLDAGTLVRCQLVSLTLGQPRRSITRAFVMPPSHMVCSP